MINLKANKDSQLYKCISSVYPEVSFGMFNKALRKKDVKVNGKRVSGNVDVSAGDEIQVYINLAPKSVDIVYQDDNIIVIDKPADLEVDVEEGECATSILRETIKRDVYPCHRIDRNTCGLVIYAYSEDDSLYINKLLTDGSIKKYYLAQVFGNPKPQCSLKGYIYKDARLKQSFIESKKTPKNKTVETNYRLINRVGEISTLEVEIPTGRTHQIRCHLASIGLPIVGDNKYGDLAKNKEYHKNRQQLQSYKLVFGDLSGKLSNLSGRVIEVSKRIDRI